MDHLSNFTAMAAPMEIRKILKVRPSMDDAVGGADSAVDDEALGLKRSQHKLWFYFFEPKFKYSTVLWGCLPQASSPQSKHPASSTRARSRTFQHLASRAKISDWWTFDI